MDQQELRALESLCIQEEQPQCQAACPLHVDVRALALAMAKGLGGEAWKALRKAMPFPGILGRLCDGPCQARCLRAEAGDAIRIAALERACVAVPGPAQRVLPLPAKATRAAVVGAGLAGLTVAWDLARKGYPVTIFDTAPALGEGLYAAYAGQLPAGVVAAETAPLAKLGVAVVPNASVTAPDFPETCLATHHAVFLSLDALDAAAVAVWDVDHDGGKAVRCDPATQATSREGVFRGGAHASPVWRAAQGRFAATSMDRRMQGVSLTARREGEGPCATRLFTSLAGVAPLPAVPMADPAAGYSPEEAAQEAARCLRCECLECVKTCAYLAAYKGYPKAYARQIYNNASIVKGNRQANRMINSCMLCGQCEAICPNDFSMATLCLDTRRGMVARGIMPPSAHDFALEDLRFNRGNAFALARHAPGATHSGYLFFPGCQLAGSQPGHVARAYDWLRQAMAGPVGLALGCCGAPALWAGRETLFAEVLDEVRETAARLGAAGKPPTLIVACATCASVFAAHAPDLPVVSVWEVMAGHAVAGATPPTAPLALHDPCTARHNAPMRDAVRAVLRSLDVPVEELRLGRELTACCGYGGLLYNANPPLARQAAAHRAAQSGNDFLAYCAMCRDNLAATGKHALHLFDLIFPGQDQLDSTPPQGQADPAARPAPGFSQRHENRARLKRHMLDALWGEKADPVPEHQAITLRLAPEVAARCEERRILVEDMQRVIQHAETTGRKLHDPATGRNLACLQPVRVTYWVEYEPAAGAGGTAYVVHNAYSHRMTIPMAAPVPAPVDGAHDGDAA
ncbi:MAG: pyridine nucleotide-disulfide oxidoreductase/dicluster-binding protein [Desulfovibrionaceae bacterium]